MPTSWGFEQARDNIATSDAVAVRRLKNAGAIVLGKTNIAPALADWQSDNPVYGRTSNPADLSRTAGGSSGGSAAALAAGFVALELGSDIGGSIRVPAHFCGVWGHKPSYDAVSSHGHRFPGTDGANAAMGVSGPMARDGDDLAAALDVLLELPLPRPGPLDPAKLRILMLADHPAGRTAHAIREAVHTAAAALAGAGAQVDDASRLIPDLAEQHRFYGKMLNITLMRGAPSAEGKVATAADWFDLQDAQARCLRAWQRVFEDYDAVLTPPNSVTAFAHRSDDFHARRLTIDDEDAPYDSQLLWAGLATFPGLPATCVPVARDVDGLPIGVQVMAGMHQDYRAIAIASLIHGAMP